MRERKFRAWEPEEKKMYHDVWFDDEEVFWDDPEDEWCVIGYYKEDKQALDFPVLEITEYVGMKDKHGKEIYEFDQLKGDWDVLNDIYLGTVEFYGGAFRIKETGLPLSWAGKDKECEIVGNKFAVTPTAEEGI